MSSLFCSPRYMAMLLVLLSANHCYLAFLLPIKHLNKYQSKQLIKTISFASIDESITGEENDRTRLKMSLKKLSTDTKRGFYASNKQRKEAKEMIESLAKINPTKEPASAYYDVTKNTNNVKSTATIAGKWTLLYTNAPDITSLDSGTNLLPSIPNAKLGRIGQECNEIESTIKNVIEWKKPEWVKTLINFTSDQDRGNDEDESRILQKVVCEAKAFPKEPSIVQLDLVGFELFGDNPNSIDASENNGSFLTALLNNAPSLDSILNTPAEILSSNPIRLKGPLKAPFGKFEVLYLDEEMRIIKTGQGYYAVNIRENETWF